MLCKKLPPTLKATTRTLTAALSPMVLKMNKTRVKGNFMKYLWRISYLRLMLASNKHHKVIKGELTRNNYYVLALVDATSLWLMTTSST